MPELPEVETIMRGLENSLLGRHFTRILLRRADLRFLLPPALPARIRGQRITGLARRAKYILIHFAHGHSLLVHLGMSGRLVIDDGAGPLLKHDHVVLHLDNGLRLRFNDARRFGLMDLVATQDAHAHRLLAGLGLEPLTRSFTGTALHARLGARKTPVKIAIMDQKLVVGVGNIYASEALFDARLDPRRAASGLSKVEAARLAASIKKVLRRAIAKGGSTLRDYVQADGALGYFQHEFRAYGRAGLPCRRCGTFIAAFTQGGRSTFWCTACQK